MKKLRTLTLIVGAVLTMGIVVGCSKTAKNYSEELSNIEKWEGTNTEITGSITNNSQGVSKSAQKNKFTLNEYSSNGEAMLIYKLEGAPEWKIYYDGITAYTNKTYYEEMYTSKGAQVPPGLASLDSEYIALEQNDTKSIGLPEVAMLGKDPDALTKIIEKVFGAGDIELPYGQKGREYTLNLDADETVDIGVKAIKSVGNAESIKSQLKPLVTPENLNKIAATVESENFQEKIPDIKSTFKGTSIESKKTFKDDSYTTELNMSLKVKDFGEILIEMKSKSTKAEKKSIDVPTSKTKLTKEEFNKLLITTPENSIKK